MSYPDKAEHALIAIFGDNDAGFISKSMAPFLSGRDLKLLEPKTEESLEQAAQNSALVLIGIKTDDDPNLFLGKRLLDNRMVAADIIAFCDNNVSLGFVSMLSNGFDGCWRARDTKDPEFKKFLFQKIGQGNKRLNGLIQEEEYRRVCDALSSAPASMMIFDADKRAVFVSDHYYRAYPRIAPRLTRGLSVYEVFSIIAKEEGIAPEDPRYDKLENFWYGLEGSLEFSLDDGVTYRLKAVRLPGKRGTVVMGQNISDYHHRNRELADKTVQLQADLEKIKTREEGYKNFLKELTGDLRRMDDAKTFDADALIKKILSFH